ncbi:hypothetical protein QWM81_07440 [Streptomyces ficellus]|uniref:Uncharacterized protein n=1 Tax=Streptomyces ficellus TaxID=1977088 RepID=A0ABT7Z320_9ACTN|nr:hypothetical protein [Streptomyces ficellus]MDN3293878.1 hypothetical protein [Streptomyces ficellus]
MQREDIPEPGESGLSTEDIAQPGGAGEAAGERPGAPAFPYESQESEERREGTAEPAESAPPTSPEVAVPAGRDEDETPQLLAPEDEEGFRDRWQGIQAKFVDDPREAVHEADALVADVMQQLASTFADHKRELEGQWNRGEEVDTEELRKALRQYRSFFNRLLTT